LEPLIRHARDNVFIDKTPKPQHRERAIFLDRDGTINLDTGYCHKQADFKLYPDVIDGMNLMIENGYRLIVVTNQSGIGRHYYSHEDFICLNSWMFELLSNEGIDIMDTFYCPHLPSDGCLCRKPLPGMLLEASRMYQIDLERSFMIGDRMTDISAGRSAGCETILLDRYKKIEYDVSVVPNYRADGLLSAAEAIILNKNGFMSPQVES